MRIDPHSYYDPQQGKISELHWKAEVDFKTKSLHAEAVLIFENPVKGIVDLDTRGLEIIEISALNSNLSWFFAEHNKILGSCLRIYVPNASKKIIITYRTSENASALQWLEPSQTAGKKYPYLYSQCQSIHARSIVPIQDSPGLRFRYTASVTVPKPLIAVMSAASGEKYNTKDGTTTYTFVMPQSIPAYLLALAVGNITSRDLGPRSRVYTEPEVIDRAAWEFEPINDILLKAEELLGPYQWDRYDFLVMPPSFPYGGMENPRLTFLTPSLIAGDRSLIDVLVHELAHSWTGNLVTNATWNDFWLNEGWTMWAQRRILEVLYGSDFSALDAVEGMTSLERDIEDFGMDSMKTRLKTDLKEIDPDEAYCHVPYEKGFLFLTLLEKTVGREIFDAFVQTYIKTFKFKSISTEEFENFTHKNLRGISEKINLKEWLYSPGMPTNVPIFHSTVLEKVESFLNAWNKGIRPTKEMFSQWTLREQLIYLGGIPNDLTREECAWLDVTYKLSESNNVRILKEWLTRAAKASYAPAFPKIKEFLGSTGRMMAVLPIYKELIKQGETRTFAETIFAEYTPAYHPIAIKKIRAAFQIK